MSVLPVTVSGSLTRRLMLLGGLAAVLGLLAFLTTRATRPATISTALARGEAPEAPHFVLPRLDADSSLDLATLRGNVVVINFWASWCIPCRDEAPALNATWERYRDRNVVVVGVNVQDLEPEARRFMRETRVSYPTVRDRDNRVYKAYGLTGVPETFFVDRSGRIVRKFPGVITDHRRWSQAVEEALAR